MLALKRETNQEIVIECPDGKRITVRLLGVERGYRASIGIDAPDNYLILRRELLDRDTKNQE